MLKKIIGNNLKNTKTISDYLKISFDVIASPFDYILTIPFQIIFHSNLSTKEADTEDNLTRGFFINNKNLSQYLLKPRFMRDYKMLCTSIYEIYPKSTLKIIYKYLTPISKKSLSDGYIGQMSHIEQEEIKRNYWLNWLNKF